MSEPTIAVFTMTEAGHFERLRPLVAGLASRGADVHVFADRRFASRAEQDGATFTDVFAGHSLEQADDASMPFPCRFVSFAGLFAEPVGREVAAIGADLVVCDSFAVIGRAVASLLGLPHVNVCPGHNMQPAATVAALRADPRLSLSPACGRAVALLRDRYGIEDASPFSYVDGNSALLNLYCEPAGFLPPGDRRHFEPVAFHGSLPALEGIDAASAADPFPRGDGTRVYASLGTVVWRYWRDRALATLGAVAEEVGRREGAVGLISLGGAEVSEAERSRLQRPGVRVEGYVDQWAALSAADIMITHQGLNSTHEAIYCGVPMISHPFFSDQPAMSRRCRELGLAVPLSEGSDAVVDPDAVARALDRVEGSLPRMARRLASAREWELETIAARPAIWDRVIELAGRPAAR